MNTTLPLLLTDFYKQVHAEQYNPKVTKLVSYFTPRMSRLKGEDKLILFGLQAFCKEYLIDYFNENFFDRPEEEVLMEYNRVLAHTLGVGTYKDEKIKKLHQLGYLPLELNAVPEGTRVPVRVPMIEISNTHPDFAWVTNVIESLMSASLWHTMLSANVGYKYRQIVNYWYDKTASLSVYPSKALGDFSFRGQHSLESAIKSSAAFCLSFLNTATVPAIPWLEKNYNCDCEKENVAYGAISTEHSVMCSNYAIDGDEESFIKKLLTEIYPKQSFSMVSDSYDYWNVVEKILPKLKKEIMEHEGTLLVRGDSGDPVDILCGDIRVLDVDPKGQMSWPCLKAVMEGLLIDTITEDGEVSCIKKDKAILYFRYKGDVYKITGTPAWDEDISAPAYFFDGWEYIEVEEYELTNENKGTVELLWETFGGHINKKGYKVLDSHIKAIYGDSITPQRCEEIYKRLEEKGFSAENVVLGVGSFSFMCLEEDGEFKPYTRDTFSVAVKTTYGEYEEKGFEIFKNPKTDNGKFKKSQKGLCRVYEKDGELTYEDGLNSETIKGKENLLQPVFINGYMVKEYTLQEVRDKLHGGEFY